MLAKGSELGGNIWRELPRNSSSVVTNTPQKRCFDKLCSQHVSNPAGFSTDWRYHPEMAYNRHWIRKRIFEIIQNEQFAPMLELLLLTTAASKEEYMNLETLNQRMQSLVGLSKSDAAGYYDVPEGRLSDPFIVHGLPCVPDDGLPTPLLADMCVLPNLPVLYGGSNLDANTRSSSNYFPLKHANNVEMNLSKQRDCLGFIQNNESTSFPTSMGKSIQFEDLHSTFPKLVSADISEQSNLSPGTSSCLELEDTRRNKSQELDFQNSFTHAMLQPTKRQKMTGFAFDVSWVNDACSDQSTYEMAQSCSFETLSEVQQQLETIESGMIPSKGLESGMIYSRNSMEINSRPTLRKELKDIDDDEEDIQGRTGFIQEGVNAKKELIIVHVGEEGIQGRTGFNQDGINDKKEIIESKDDQEKQTKSPNTIVEAVSLIDLFTRDQIEEHISSLRKESVQITSEEEAGIDANTCQLCQRKKLYFAPVPIFCSCCGVRIRRTYFCRKEEEFDAQGCICSVCYKTSKGGKITFNGAFVSKTNLVKKNNDEVFEEPWVECNKCKRWQHQICALYNNKRDLDSSAEYICPVCRLKEIENGIHVPLPKAANFCAKDLPRTMLSDHLEKRLFERLVEERANWEKVEGNENLDKVSAAESLSIREVLSVDKQLKVNKLFLDIIPEENYPAEFSYRSRVILLFQQIEGVDICIFGMYAQEFGSECGNPNQRCVHISYLDSVKYFRPERRTKSGEALRTFVYHEILIGYLDFCKKRGFSTCYIWACAPSRKGDDYILYCHPEEQKTPKNDKLRRWYLSMIKKATEENIIVGLTNVYDHFFVPTEKGNSKVTTSRLPYFDGDYWCGYVMEAARTIEKESGGDYEKMLKKQVPNRALKTMGHANPSKDTAKDILVMQKVGQKILPTRENFIIAHLQYSCMHCHEVIVSGKRWFCTECKKFQECERCHSSDAHISKNGEVHALCQAVVDDIPSNTMHNDIILESGLFENRNSLLSFCQKYQFQFDILRRAKYSSMMILYHLNNPTLVTVGKCSICCAHNIFQKCWKCEICPECAICSACYKDRGANCHEHKLTQNELTLTQNYSTPLCQFGNRESNEKTMLKLLDVLKHASQCRATNAEPCSYPNCSQIKKLFSHARRCEIRVNRGCQHCKKIWFILTAHSRNCKDSECRIPRCRDLKKHIELKAMHSESWRGTAVIESDAAVVDQ